MENGKCPLEKDDVVVNKDNASRGIYVTGFPSNITASELVIHFQKRKHGGGDIECLHITEERFAVIIFDDPSVAESVVKKRHVLCSDNVPLQVDLLSEWVNFGTANAPESLAFRLSFPDSSHKKKRVAKGSDAKSEADESGETGPGKGSGSSFYVEDQIEPQQFEINEKFFHLLIKTHDRELQEIEHDHEIKIDRVAMYQRVTVEPTKHCSTEKFSEGCDAFITLYQNVHNCMKLVEFVPSDQKSPSRVRQRIRVVGRAQPLLIEVCEDRKHWKVYGEKMFVEKFLRDLQKEDLIDWTAQEAGSWCQNGTDEDDENFESEDQLEHKLDANTVSKKEHHRGPDGALIPQVQVRSDIEQMRQALDDEKRTRDVRKQELKEKEKLLLSQLENALGEEKQKRARLEEELSRVKNAGNERARTLENRLRDTFRLYELKKGEVREKVAAVDKLQVLLEENQQEKSEIKNQLSQQQKFCTKLEERLKAEQLSIQELRLKVEQGREQKIALEQTVGRLLLQFTEEKDRHASIERDLQLALSTTQAEASELLRSGTRDWILLREEVTLGRKVLGKGAWGTVSEGTFRGCKVAVKEIHELILSDHNRRLFEREMNMASRCRHPNLLQFIGATNDDGSPLFITELLDTCLRRLLSERKLTPKEVLNLALDIAKALNYLHLNKPLPIIHRDISSANVLLWRRGECWRAKLSDYGAANFMQRCMTTNTGAMIYSAPEAFTPKQSPKVDVYSFGVLLCEMCIREQPDPQGLSDQIKRVSDDTFRQLIRRCVEKEPDKRLTMAEVIPSLEQC